MSHGGLTLAKYLRKRDKNIEIIIVEKQEYISYSQCAMPYYISGEVSEEDIVFNSAQDLKEKYDLEIYLKTEVIEIYADSSYVLKGITEWIENWIKKDFKNVKNVELWKKLYNLKGQIEKLPSIKLVFNKVKGHNGDKYNEMVDKLASNAAMEVI